MFKNSSAKYYQNNKEKPRKNICERYQSISKEEKEKGNKMVMKNTKIYLKLKNKSLLSMKKYY